jgi:glycosyltransferase involved in cell wall biosynthesis
MGGAEAALVEVISGLAQQRPSWRLGLIAASDGPLVARARAAGADVRVVPFPPALARLGEWSAREDGWPRLTLAIRCAGAAWPAQRYLARLRHAVRELAPDIVHTNGLKMHLLGAWAIPSGTPLVWHLHDYAGRRPLSALALARSARGCAALLVPSQSVADDVRTLGGARLPIHPIWNAVDLERFSPDGSTMDLDGRSGLPAASADVVRVGLVATFARWKGHHLFLAAIARLPPALNVRAYVIGGPLYETENSEVSIEELRQVPARLGIADRVGFTGFIEDSAPAIRALDVVVHASTEPEPFGLAIAEGMACGRAVVVSREGGAAELVTAGVDALTFTPGDAGALAHGIGQLAADPGLRQRLGQRARATAERRFSRRRLTTEVLDVYERVAAAASPRGPAVHRRHVHGGVERS